MVNPTFVKTAHHYDSYTDFWRLVELSGFDTIKLSAIDVNDPDAVYIITPVNGEWQDGWEHPRARIIAWILEWYTELPSIPGVAAYWASDRWYAQHIRAQFVPFGSHHNLVQARHDPVRARWDVALLAYMGPARREAIRQQLQEAGLSIAPMGWRDTRDDILEHSRVLVHIHQHSEYPAQAVQRFAFAAAARIPLISERMNDSYPLRSGDHFLSFEYDTLAKGITATLRGNVPLARMADQMNRVLCHEHSFAKNVIEALNG